MSNQVNTLDLPLAGVESEHCALIVDKGLEKVQVRISNTGMKRVKPINQKVKVIAIILHICFL